MEKAKSLLIYYSNRFLDGALDSYINSSFGEIFQLFSEIKDIGTENNINVISNRRFDEDSVMRYHFLAYAEDHYDYDASVTYVLDNYLKISLKPLRSNNEELYDFIHGYVTDLLKYYRSFLRLIQKVEDEEKYYKIFSVLQLSATLYPLLIRLESRGFLENRLSVNPVKSFADLIEIADVRVYKVRGTNPRADMSYLAKKSRFISASAIEEELIDFITRFMDDSEFERRLTSEYQEAPIVHVILEYSENNNNRKYELSDLKQYTALQPTVEHIISQNPKFDFPNLGFRDEEDFQQHIRYLGNLTVLEKSINSKCQNKNPHQKITEGHYSDSVFEDPNSISAIILNRGTSFEKQDIIKRTDKLAKFCMNKWDFKNTN